MVTPGSATRSVQRTAGGVTVGAVTAGAVTLGAVTVGTVGRRMTTKPISPSAMRMTTLITTMSPVGMDFFLAAAGVAAGAGVAGAGGAATTGAGALLIMRVKSLGPDEAPAWGDCAPPNGESGVLPPAAKMGGGRMPGAPPNGAPPPSGDGAAAGVGAPAVGNGGAMGAGGTKGDAGEDWACGWAPNADGALPNNGVEPIDGGGADGVAATGGQAGGGAAGATGEAGVTWGSGAAVAGAENIRVKSPGPCLAGAGETGCCDPKML